MLGGLTKRLQHSASLRRIATIGAATAAVLLPGTALAVEEPPPPTGSAVIQYAELVPTGEGAKAPGVGKKSTAPLPAKAKKALANESAKTAGALTVVATSSDYGAPTTARPSTKPRTKPELQAMPSPAKPPSLDRTLIATAAAASPVDGTRMIGLLVALAGIAVAGGVLSARAHRA